MTYHIKPKWPNLTGKVKKIMLWTTSHSVCGWQVLLVYSNKWALREAVGIILSSKSLGARLAHRCEHAFCSNQILGSWETYLPKSMSLVLTKNILRFFHVKVAILNAKVNTLLFLKYFVTLSINENSPFNGYIDCWESTHFLGSALNL